MECNCGGQVKDMRNKSKNYALTFVECVSCGRVGSQVLKRDGCIISKDEKAVIDYRLITDD